MRSVCAVALAAGAAAVVSLCLQSGVQLVAGGVFSGAELHDPRVARSHDTLIGAGIVGAFGIGLAMMADLLAGKTNRHVARLALGVGVAAMLPLSWNRGDMAPAALALTALALAIGATVVRPGAGVRKRLERLTQGAFASAVVALVLSGALLLVASFERRDGDILPSLRAGSLALYDGVVWVAGLGLLGLAAMMFTLFNADRAVWSAPETWVDADIDANRTITFTNGTASRQAAVSFGTYVGPVVVMPLGAVRKGVFRGDGAPDDGWTVPGTVATLGDAVMRSEIAARATVIFVTLLGVATLLTAMMTAWRAL